MSDLTKAEGKSTRSQLISFYRRVVFGKSLLGLLINPFYISRRALRVGIENYSSLVAGGRLLDLGCGGQPYRRCFDVDHYIGMDVMQSGHDHSSSKIDIVYDGKRIPLSDNSIDHVFSSEVLEHVFYLEPLLQEINRITKAEGTLLITLPFVWDEHEIPYDFARYTSFGIQSLLERNGFTIVQSHKSTKYIGTIFQMLAAYVSQCILPKNRYFRIALTPFLVAPINAIGLLLSLLLPDNEGFYLNNIMLCRKSIELDETTNQI